MGHGNTRLSEHTRQKMVLDYLERGKSAREITEDLEISRKTVYFWVKRYLSEGEAGLRNGRSGPRSSPRGTPRGRGGSPGRITERAIARAGKACPERSRRIRYKTMRGFKAKASVIPLLLPAARRAALSGAQPHALHLTQ